MELPELPSQIKVGGCLYCMDGGTILISARSDTSQTHQVMLVQSMNPASKSFSDTTPGGLYFDGHLIPIRSELEMRVLYLLETATADDSPPSFAPLVDAEESAKDQLLQISPDALVIGDDFLPRMIKEPKAAGAPRKFAWRSFDESDRMLTLCFPRKLNALKMRRATKCGRRAMD